MSAPFSGWHPIRQRRFRPRAGCSRYLSQRTSVLSGQARRECSATAKDLHLLPGRVARLRSQRGACRCSEWIAILGHAWPKVDSIALLSTARHAVRGHMTKKVELVASFSLCCVVIATAGTVSEFVARADDSVAVLYGGVSGLRQPCGPLTDDPRLRVAAQRHADDMLRTGLSGHIGSDGSSPRTRIAEAGYNRTPPRVRSFIGALGQRRIPPRPSTRGCKALHTERSS